SVCSSFFFVCAGRPRDLPSFPTRRSSDLQGARRDLEGAKRAHAGPADDERGGSARLRFDRLVRALRPAGSAGGDSHAAARSGARSEEHTSELQSPCNLVCRLLLEKKKKQ